MIKETLYIYTRVSSEKQESGYSLAAQKKAGKELAKKLKMNYEILDEESESSKFENIDNRPKLQELLNKVEEGKAKNVFVTEIDRLSRNDLVSAHIKKIFKDNDVILYTVNGKYEFNNYDNILMYEILSSFAKRENSQRVRRSMAGKELAVKEGKYVGGIPPFGYKVDENNYLVVDEEEKKIYLQIVSYSLSGMGAKRIAKKLNEMKIPTKASKYYKKGLKLRNKYTGEIIFKDKKLFIWKQGTIERILKNPLYKGERTFKNLKIKIEPLIDEKTWQQIQDNFKKNRKFSLRNNKSNFYLLKSLVFCNRCNKVLIGRINEKKGFKVYYCLSKRSEETKFCGMKSINIDKLNNLVWEKLLFILSNSDLVRKEVKRKFSNKKINIDEIKKEIKLLKEKLKEKDIEKENLIRIATKNIITDDELKKYLIEIEIEKKSINDKINANEEKIKLIDEEESIYKWILILKDKIKELYYLKDDIKKQRIIRTFINKITVDYIEETKNHVIEIEMKYPIYDNKNTTKIYLSDGTDLDEINTENINLKERYEIENEYLEEENIKNVSKSNKNLELSNKNNDLPVQHFKLKNKYLSGKASFYCDNVISTNVSQSSKQVSFPAFLLTFSLVLTANKIEIKDDSMKLIKF